MVRRDQIPLRKLCEAVKNMRDKKFDAIIVIDGNRGLGKSTLAYLMAKKTQKDKSIYRKFNPYRDLIYKRSEVLKAFERWDSTFVADEMINVTFNRDFYNEEQKNIIKIINMNRDHRNIFIACVPNFSSLDKQFQDLVKLRITIIKRGVGIIQKPKKSLYSPDKWDIDNNRKIEREWLKANKNPRYRKLTTYRGVVRFPDLKDDEREVYEQIKISKRNNLFFEEEATEKDPRLLSMYDRTIELLKQGKVDEDLLKTLSFQAGREFGAFKGYLNTKLKKKNLILKEMLITK